MFRFVVFVPKVLFGKAGRDGASSLQIPGERGEEPLGCFVGWGYSRLQKVAASDPRPVQNLLQQKLSEAPTSHSGVHRHLPDEEDLLSTWRAISREEGHDIPALFGDGAGIGEVVTEQKIAVDGVFVQRLAGLDEGEYLLSVGNFRLAQHEFFSPLQARIL